MWSRGAPRPLLHRSDHRQPGDNPKGRLLHFELENTHADNLEITDLGPWSCEEGRRSVRSATPATRPMPAVREGSLGRGMHIHQGPGHR